MTHAEATRMVHGKGNRMRRKVGNNTYAEILPDGSVGIMLHSTYVVKISPENLYTLSTGGWTTSTTKDRINKYSPVRVHQRNFEWYITLGGKEFPFMEGMVVG